MTRMESLHALASFIFWSSVFGIAYTFAGYRLLLEALCHLRSRRAPKASIIEEDEQACDSLPTVTVLIVAYNEGKRIHARIANVLASDYPANKLWITVVSDGSEDDTAAEVSRIGDPRVRLYEQPKRLGKAAGINAGIAATVTSDLVVFSDSRQRFEPGAIRKLAGRFRDPAVGAVSGALEIAQSKTSAGKGVSAYWSFEKGMRAAESRLDSCIGCTGAIYAIRTELYLPIPEDTVLDDVVIPMQIAMRGARVLHASDAIAFDPQPLEPEAEQRRKQRTLAGNFQMLFRQPEWLNPLRSRLWWQLASHKYMRLVTPLELLLIFCSNLFLLDRPFYRMTLGLQVTLYVCAIAGLCFPRLATKFLSLPAGFVFLNVSIVNAFFHYLTNKELHRWKPA